MNKTVVVVCVTAITIAVIGLVGWVSYTNGDVERVLGWSGTILAPLLIGLASVFAVREVNGKVDHAAREMVTTKEDVRVIKVQTNGKMKAFADRLAALEKLEQERKGQG